MPLITPGRIVLTKGQHGKVLQMTSAASKISKSLRMDIVRHPNDFLIFDTRTAASHFIQGHVADVNLETEPRMIESGIVGYWRGKTVVVLPIVSSRLGETSQGKN